MSVTKENFDINLPYLLEDTANAAFIAIDLKLSGIPDQQLHTLRTDGRLPTLQEKYADNKRAAEQFHVLQLGITCAEADHHSGKYILKPYNILVSPLADRQLEIKRVFSYQNDAVHLLLEHNFPMGASFLQGVPYLSRQEEAIMRRSRQEKASFAGSVDIEVKEDDVQSIRFLKNVAKGIHLWKSKKVLRHHDFLDVPSRESFTEYLNKKRLNGFQRKLVHQFVRTHHPDLVSIPQGDFVRIKLCIKGREDAHQARRDSKFEENVEKQVGLRWPVEAMAGGDLSGLTVRKIPVQVEAIQGNVAQQFAELKAMLKHKRTVLVGHEIFMDLVYFYQCFIGQLPDRIGEFQLALHELFPLIIDTKYLAITHGNPTLARSDLEGLAGQLTQLPFPIIETDDTHAKYTSSKPAHEAGYDSFQTAKVLILLSAEIAGEGQYVGEEISKKPDDEFFTPAEEGIVAGETPSRANFGSESDIDKVASKFSHTGMYDLLGDLQEDSPQSSKPAPKPIPPMMPSFDSYFWAVYGNKLQVPGTIEGFWNVLGG